MAGKILLKQRAIVTFYPLIKLYVRLMWRSCRIRVVGEERAAAILRSGEPVIPCYWHQMQFFCTWYILQLAKRGLKIGFLVSPSKDGEIPAKILQSWGIEVIRGSASRTGAQAMRDLYNVIVKQGISPVHTPDGPRGPIHKFKPGTVMLSQMTKTPLLALAFAADRAWYLKSWDRFILPKPFARIVIAVGEPKLIRKSLRVNELQSMQDEMETILNKLAIEAKSALEFT